MRPTALVLLVAALATSGCYYSVAFLSPNLKLHITNISAVPVPVPLNGTSELTAAIDNPTGGKLTYAWAAHAGTIVGNGASASYRAGACCTSTDVVALVVKNEKGEADTLLKTLDVLQPPDTTQTK